MSNIGNKTIFNDIGAAWENLRCLGITSNLSEENENIWLDSVEQAIDSLDSANILSLLIRQRYCLSRISGILRETDGEIWDSENAWRYLATVGELMLRLIKTEGCI